MKPDDAYSYLDSRRDLVRRLPGEKVAKKKITTFEGVTGGKQLALWRDIKSGTRIKLESYAGDIAGVKLVECRKNDDLVSRLKNGRGVCVQVKNKSALIELVEHYYNFVLKASSNESKSSLGEGVTKDPSAICYRDFGEAPNDDLSSLNEFARRVRAGQRAFKNRLLELYGSKCAISGEATQQVLEAAHILDHASTGINQSDNGLLLRSDIHLLFDKGYLAIDPNSYEVWIHPDLKGSAYWELNGASLRKRSDGKHPDASYLLNKWYKKRA